MTSRRPSRLRVLGAIASSELGGAERVFADLGKGLDHDRFELWIACHGEGPLLEEYRRIAFGVHVVNLRDVGPSAVMGLARLIRHLRCDVVHSHLWTTDVLVGLAAALARVPVRITTVHTEYFRTVDERGLRKLRKRVLSGMYRLPYALFDRVVAVSQAIADDLGGRPGVRVRPERVQVVQNGIDLSRFPGSSSAVARDGLGLPTRAPVVVTVANFVPMKGHRWLIQAIPGVLEQFPDTSFVLVGTGKELATIRNLVSAAGLGSRVRFLGARRDALEVLALGDVVVVPSVAAEGSSIVSLEAMALGRPLVATAVGGIPELVRDGETGILVPPRDSPALARAICALLSDPVRMRVLGQQGRELVRARFSLEGMVRQIERLYVELAVSKGIVDAGWSP